MAEKIAILVDLENVILKEITQQNEMQITIMEQLNRVEQPYRNILHKTYIQGKTLVTVASEMNYSYEHMKHMHGIALNEFDKTTLNLTE